MFFKSFFLNIKNSTIKYVLLFFCLTAVITAAIVASGIMADSMNDVSWTASSMTVVIGDRVNVRSVRDELYAFLEESEPGFQRVWIDPALSRKNQSSGRNQDVAYTEELAELYGSISFLWFPSYEGMKDYLTYYWHIDEGDLPTEEQYLNEKVIILGPDTSYFNNELQEFVTIPYTYTDENHVLICGEEFLVVGHCKDEVAWAFLGGVPDEMLTNYISFTLSDIPTLEQIDVMTSRINEILGGNCRITEPKTRDLLDYRKSAANIVTTILVQIIAVLNVLIIYSYIIESRKRQFAVMRFCGFGKIKCLLYMWGEIIAFSVICFPTACVIFDLVKPTLANKYQSIKILFTPGYYTALGLMFLAAASAAFVAYVIPTFGRSISNELREM